MAHVHLVEGVNMVTIANKHLDTLAELSALAKIPTGS